MKRQLFNGTKLIFATCRGLGVASAILIGFMVVATLLLIALREVTNQSNATLFYAIELALPMSAFLAMGLVGLADRNPRVDLVPQRPKGLRTATDIGSRAFTTLISGYIAWHALHQAVDDQQTGITVTSETPFPRWILMATVTLGFLLLAIVEARSALILWRRPGQREKEVTELVGTDRTA